MGLVAFEASGEGWNSEPWITQGNVSQPMRFYGKPSGAFRREVLMGRRIPPGTVWVGAKPLGTHLAQVAAGRHSRAGTRTPHWSYGCWASTRSRSRAGMMCQLSEATGARVDRERTYSRSRFRNGTGLMNSGSPVQPMASR